jgi:protoporphyrin/coproporphyrin ferrochelatase
MKGILLVNLGSPNSPSVKDVRRYLTQFLNDPLVIDIHPVARFFLVNFIIVPFRAPKSAKLYEAIWTKEGSPLITHSIRQKELLQQSLGDGYRVELGMRYQNPSIESAFKKLVAQKAESIVVIPLYPHWASSSTGSTIEEVKRVAQKRNYKNIKIVEKFYDNEDYLNACVDAARKYNLSEYDYFVFSYHGLPERQITKIYPSHCQLNDSCCSSISEKNKLCYRAACYYTTRELVKRLAIPEGKYISSFQSRLDDQWLKPYSDKVVEQLAKEGKKRILVFSPAFVSDCLETIYEIGIEYQHIFKQHGGEKIQLAESLNENPTWIEALRKLSIHHSK